MVADLIPILITLWLFGSIAYIVYISVESRRRGEALKVASEFHAKLLDRMGSATELSQFLGSEGGSRFLDSITLERRHPAERILRSTSVGLVITAIGIACWVVGSTIARDPDVRAFMGGAAIFGLAIGIAFLVSAATSFVLSRSFGLLDQAHRPSLPPVGR